jgi:transposase
VSSLAASKETNMTKVPYDERLVTLGVDTHADIHVAVALDHLGGMLGALEIPTTRAGYQQLLEWASSLGVIDRVGIEGTGSYGAGLFRWLRARGITVIEVDRPDRKLRRQRGKDDITDAEGAARSVLSGQATGIPKSADGNVEMIRVLRVARRSARRCAPRSPPSTSSTPWSCPPPTSCAKRSSG